MVNCKHDTVNILNNNTSGNLSRPFLPPVTTVLPHQCKRGGDGLKVRPAALRYSDSLTCCASSSSSPPSIIGLVGNREHRTWWLTTCAPPSLIFPSSHRPSPVSVDQLQRSKSSKGLFIILVTVASVIGTIFLVFIYYIVFLPCVFALPNQDRRSRAKVVVTTSGILEVGSPDRGFLLCVLVD